MSQGALAAGRLAATVRPGRAAASYGDLIAARLRRLAAAGRTGMLPFGGHGDGAIYFSGGRVVFAESARTPGPAAGHGGIGSPVAGSPAGGALAAGADAGATGPGAALALAEPIADAALDLLDSQASPARFRSARLPPAGLADGFSVESLLAEVTRRQHILTQIAGTIRADVTVVRRPRMAAAQVQVSALQWALLVRVRDGSTARALAWELRRSVFGVTIDVYRLVVLRLLAVPDGPVRAGTRALREPPERQVLAMSFTRAVAGRPGSAG